MRRMLFPVALGAAFLAGTVIARAEPMSTSVKAFHDLCDKAMGAMMAGMETPSEGDVDRDFVAMMAPHHQGAIDMAVAELRYGHDQTLQRIAQEIIVDQQQEIAAMRLALHQPLPSPAPAPTLPANHPDPPTTRPSP